MKKLVQRSKIWKVQMIILLLVLLHVCIFDLYSLLKIFSYLALMDVGGNVLQAASKTVSKDKENDPDTVIEVNIKITCFFLK